ncbi:MAG: hypothetical protein VB957_02770 [Pseudomonadales bacterium]|jgi:hypothetical protein
MSDKPSEERIERRDGTKDRREDDDDDRRGEGRVVTELNSRRQKSDRRKD